ncbi:MAG: alpha/beta hydrolase [Gammaproteobacteria bacterium]
MDEHQYMRSSLRFLRCLLLCACLVSGCTAGAFLAANASSAFGPYDRTVDLAYGPEPRQRLDIYVPDKPSVGSRPVIVFIHGGSWRTGSKDQYRFVGSGLAEKDYISVLPNYRLNPEVRFPVFVEDAALAVAWTLRNIDRYGGDPRRVYIMGHSAGAYIALLLTLDRSYLAAAGVSTDELRGAIGLSGPYDFKINSDLLRAVFGSAPDQQRTQPVNFARGDAPPLLLIHGTDDSVCLDRNSIRLAELVREAGGPVSLKLYPGLGHGDTVGGFSRLGRARAPTLEDIGAFVTAH